LDRAANGHVWIHTESKRAFRRVRRILILRCGFIRWGVWIPPIAGEGIFPDYIRGGLRIHAGYDDWLGYDFLAANTATDTFLIAFVSKYFSTYENRLKTVDREATNSHT
jgi:hypothetical protein